MPTEKEFYEEIKQRLLEDCNKVGIDTTARKSDTPSSGYNSAKSRNSQSSQQRQSLRFNTSLSDESDGEMNQLGDANVKKNARLEYKNVMNRLKNPNKEHRFGDDPGEAKRRSAHLTVREVDPDEWLDDDLGPSRKKQKFYNENQPNYESPSKRRSPVKAFSRTSSTVLFDSDSDGADNLVQDAFDVVMGAGDRSKVKPKRRNSTKSQSKPTSQPSLLDSGFSRFIEVEDLTKTSPVKNSSFNGNSSFQQLEKQVIIRVQVDDEKVIVPVNRDAANELKISWLVEEVAQRFYW